MLADESPLGFVIDAPFESAYIQYLGIEWRGTVAGQSFLDRFISRDKQNRFTMSISADRLYEAEKVFQEINMYERITNKPFLKGIVFEDMTQLAPGSTKGK